MTIPFTPEFKEEFPFVLEAIDAALWLSGKYGNPKGVCPWSYD
jgi:hypothetical protein